MYVSLLNVIYVTCAYVIFLHDIIIDKHCHVDVQILISLLINIAMLICKYILDRVSMCTN